MEKLYTCAQVAERYGVSPLTVREWIRGGMLEAIRLGRDYRVSEEDLVRFEQRRRTHPSPHSSIENVR
ncbi:MAG: helix-turn-helix domain-containing protein [Gemmiger sp.]|uniref:helix-turn-helix domain-containing protein n=1 Tax=Gemmiger sp. TaxID=2049027 RepID=UPI002E78D127|nr:helix-turn-helix domain-containing protein [Gemmiger sp.]MEE0801075.1 helix-turn-helix domain-containing protein [Gemmiger sp.]